MLRKDFALTPAQRADAREAVQLLDGSGMSLADAARKALHGRRALHRVTVLDAVDQFLRSRLTNGSRSRTVEWYEVKLSHLTAAFGERRLDDIDRPQIMDWLKSLEKNKVSEGTRAGLVRAARALWRWSAAQEPPMATIDATIGLKGTGPSNQGDAQFLTIDESSAVLAALGPYQSAGAILFFAGMRPEEVSGAGKPHLLWRHVRADERMIRVPAEIAKTGKPRIIEGLPETIWHWLKKPAGARDDQPIAPGRNKQIVGLAKKAITRKPWPHDAIRHTFATYALAFTGDPGKVAMWLGHESNPSMLHRHYRGLATKAEGEEFFALRPLA